MQPSSIQLPHRRPKEASSEVPSCDLGAMLLGARHRAYGRSLAPMFCRRLVLVALVLASCNTPAVAPSSSPTIAPSLAVASAPPSASAPATWRRIADIPTPRSELAAAVSQQVGRVFTIGGAGGPQIVERYDPAADRWDRAADLPIAVDHAMAAAVEGLQSAAPQGVFVFGGYLAGGTAT